MKIYRDGSVRFRQPLPMVLTNFTQDPNDPCLYWPDFLSCKLRYRPEQRSPCGKVSIGGHTCRINSELVIPKTCIECKVREPE